MDKIKAVKPKILAPAGDKYSFFAAIAAGADAIYCGLKNFSARMEAENFSIEELSRLNALAREKNVQLYVAFNSLVKNNELEQASKVVAKLAKYVRPNALIIQDPGIIAVARNAGFKGDFHLSTLGNCSFPTALQSALDSGFSKVVLPRELSIDEIKIMSEKRPEGLELEVFIHGALCYSVSGRCYWSSWLGGKSGLRGRCVQPCRRVYKQESLIQIQSESKQKLNQKSEIKINNQHNELRFCSCLDFSADVLVKVLKGIEGVTTWKIEGRKKSPHYVFYTVKAYKMLRDYGDDSAQKKIALSFLEYALGRPSVHYNLLTQNPISPLKKDKNIETGSGLFTGRVRYGGENLRSDVPNFITREALLKDDLLRIGYEDDNFHTIERVTIAVPKKGRFVFPKTKNYKVSCDKNSKQNINPQNRAAKFRKGSPIFIVDRREKEVWQLINEIDAQFNKYSPPVIRPQDFEQLQSSAKHYLNSYEKQFSKCFEITLYGSLVDEKRAITNKSSIKAGLWLSDNSIKSCSPKKIKDIWWFLPPVIYPVDESIFYNLVQTALLAGAENFVLNMPWQISFFNKSLNLWAGPFCNVGNIAYIEFLKQSGFSGVFISPELGQDEILSLPQKSPLPLGIAIKGNFPLAISRIISDEIVLNQMFTSPKGEGAWITKKDNNFWIFPNWQLDLLNKKEILKQAGYKFVLNIDEPIPNGVIMKQRPGLWNWEIGLL